MTLRFTRDLSEVAVIEAHLAQCDGDFHPPLSTRVDLSDYAAKLARHAVRFEAWDGNTLVGLVAVYCNAPDGNTAFITNVSVLGASRSQGIGRRLLDAAIGHAVTAGFDRISLEVGRGAPAAIMLYTRVGFKIASENGDTVQLELLIRGETR